MDWRVKASIQKVLSFSRFGDRLNHRLITFNPNYHQNVALYQSWECLRKFKSTPIEVDANSTALEIGTGYSLIAATVLSLLGFDKIVTVDISRDIEYKTYRKQIAYLDKELLTEIIRLSRFSEDKIQGLVKQIMMQKSISSILQLLHIEYIAPYRFNDIEKICNTFNYISSQVVLEHVTPENLNELFYRTKSWLNSNGYAVHTINFMDHFANPGIFQDKSISEFNFLRFSDE